MKLIMIYSKKGTKIKGINPVERKEEFETKILRNLNCKPFLTVSVLFGLKYLSFK